MRGNHDHQVASCARQETHVHPFYSTLPGLAYIPGTLSASHGVIDDSDEITLRWTGYLSDTVEADISYSVRVRQSAPGFFINRAEVDAGMAGNYTLVEAVVVNGFEWFLPFFRNWLANY